MGSVRRYRVVVAVDGSHISQESRYLDFIDAGAPGVPDDVLAMGVVDAEGETAAALKAEYVGEAADAYITGVLSCLAENPSWRPFLASAYADYTDEMSHHEPRLHDGDVDLDSRRVPTVTAHGALRRELFDRQLERNTRLQEVLLRGLPKRMAGRTRRPGASDFLPVPGTPTPAVPHQPFIAQDPPGDGPPSRPLLPRPAGAELAPVILEGLNGGNELTVVRLPWRLRRYSGRLGQVDWHQNREVLEALLDRDEDLVRVPSLPLLRIERRLRQMGFESSGVWDGIKTQDMRYEWWGQEVSMMIDVAFHHRLPRSLQIEWIADADQSTDSPTGRWLIQQLLELATDLCAELIDLGG